MKERLINFIVHGEGDFNTLAIDLFERQYRLNLPYRRFCESKGVTPSHVRHWRDLTAVPTDVFRFTKLFCGEPAEAPHIFRTSGTTNGARGEHLLATLEVYHTSASIGIERYLNPDRLSRPALMLAPSPAAMSDSSLSNMLGLIATEHAPNATFAWGSDGLDTAAAIDWLGRAERAQLPVQVLATSFALMTLFDAMRGTSIRLPARSLVMPTGGTKGKTREVTPLELEALIVQQLGVEISHIVQEFGMTELGSQLYDPRLAMAVAGKAAEGPARLKSPPWCRVTVHEPMALKPLPPGHKGLLRFTDLSNLDSVCSVQTSDLGILTSEDEQGDTIEFIGRTPGAVPRGCSLMVEEMRNIAQSAAGHFEPPKKSGA